MKKFIAICLAVSALFTSGALTASAFTINDSTESTVNVSVGSGENVRLTVSGSKGEDLVLRVFDSNNSIVYTNVILAPQNTDSDDVFEFKIPDTTIRDYTAIISGNTDVKTVKITYTAASSNKNTGGGGGGGGSSTPAMSDSTYPWTASIEDLTTEIEKATTEKRAIDIVKKITDATKTDTNSIEKDEETSQKASESIEQIASNVNSQTVKADSSNSLSLVKSTIKSSSVSKLKSTLNTLQKTVEDGDVQLNRDLFSEYVINTQFKEDKTATIKITKGLLDSIKDIDTLTVADDNFRVSYKVSELQEMLGSKSEMSITVDQPKVEEEESSIKKLAINFNTENVNTMKVSFPGIEGNTDYMSVVDENGNPVGGKYNPLTGCIEAKINAAGVYSVIINEKDFVDIKNAAAETQEAIKVLAAKGIIAGTSETEFSPENPITRAEIAALMLRILAKNDPNEDGGFDDVTQQNWYFGTAGSAKKQGLISGYDDNTFRGENVILNDQLTAVAARLLRNEMRYLTPQNPDDYLTFTDKDNIAEWSRNDIATARMADIVLMNSDGAFYPNESMTRANAAIIIKRMYDKIK